MRCKAGLLGANRRKGWNISSLSLRTYLSPRLPPDYVTYAEPKGLFFKPDGTSVFFTTASGSVAEYSLSTPWSLASGSYVKAFSVSSRDAAPAGLSFSPDGLRMNFVGYNGKAINSYALSAAWDIATASYVRSYSVASKETQPLDVFFRPDGLAMYVVGEASPHNVEQYSISDAWNVSTASHVGAFDLESQDTQPQGIAFSPSGSRMYYIGGFGNRIYEYHLASEWDVTSALYEGSAVIGGSPARMFFRDDGLRLYVIDWVGLLVNEFGLS